MAERPLLIFPTPQPAALEIRQRIPRNSHTGPSHGRQGERVSLQLGQLQSAFEGRLAEMQASPEGIDPSQVVVIETIGTVQQFATAVRNMDGLEWLADFEIDEITPDDDFYLTNTKGERNDNELRGRLFLVFSNQVAMNQLLSLWGRYQRDPNMQWPQNLTSLRGLFDTLYTIRLWGIRDRLEESGALEAWREDLDHSPDEPIRTEIELWYRGSASRRATAQSDVERLVRDAGGRILRRCEIGEIAYQAILVELPRLAITQIVDDPATELVKCDSIMYFRPTGQIAAGDHPSDTAVDDAPTRDQHPFPTGDPTIAVLDGLPVENHSLLKDRLSIEDPDDLSPTYLVRDRNHGTAMCSLIVWGDLAANEAPLARPVYLRPVTAPTEAANPPFPERMPSDQLAIDLIHRAVKRMFDGEAGEAPTAPTVKIINLSIGDRSRPFMQMISPFARLIDWLSHKYGVLFVISAGNQNRDIELGISRGEFESLSHAEREEFIFKKLYGDLRHRRLLSPAESINGITVNATHHDGGGEVNTGRLFELFKTPLPSPISSFGGGYRRSIKPDVAYPGGRVVFDYSLSGDRLTCTSFTRAPGHQAAAPGSRPGENDKATFCRGTSNAAALVSRNLGIAHDTMIELFDEQAGDVDPDPYLAPLLKTLLIHSGKWDLAGLRLKELLSDQYSTVKQKDAVSRLLGYGEPDINRMLDCTRQRATVLGFGSLAAESGHVFAMPLPAGLGQQKTPRRLTVTLAWLSPIRSTDQRYRSGRLFFDLDGNRLATKRQEADHNTVRRGTVQHEIFDGKNAIAITSGDFINVKVSCKEDAAPLTTPIHYGLAVSLEVADNINIDIYDQVRAVIKPEIGIRTRNPIE